MPTPQDLERLRALLGQLEAIGGAQRGELIRADDWNMLVRAVEDLARAVLAADAAAAVPAHEHLDQITADWLSPGLRDLLERGPLADPAVQKRLTEIEQTLRRTRESQDVNDRKVEEFRGRLTDVAARDVERQAAVTSIRRVVDSVADPRPELQNMRSTLGVIQRDMSTVLDAASRLSVEGQVVDLGAIVTRVGALEEMRERLRTANGELLDAATIETRIAEIANRTITPETLDGILDSRPATISEDQIAGLETRLGGELRDQFNGVLDGFRTEIDSGVTTRLDGVEGLIATRVSDAAANITTSVTASLAPAIDTARRSAVDEATAAATRAIAAADADIRADLTVQVTDATVRVTADLQAQIGQRIASELGATGRAIADAVARIDALAVESARLDTVQRAQAQTLAAVPQQMVALRTELRDTVLSEIELRTRALTRSLDDQLATFQKAHDERFEAFGRDLRQQLLDEVRKTTIETAQTETRLLRTQLLAETRTIAREEANALMREQVQRSVNEAVKEQFAAVPGMVAAEVRRVNATRTDTGGTVVQPGNPRIETPRITDTPGTVSPVITRGPQ